MTGKETALYATHKPGEFYKAERIGGHIFHVYYGYANGSTNEMDIIPQFPDLVREEVYMEEGRDIGWRVACGMNEGCEFYSAVTDFSDDGFCMDCKYYPDGHLDFGVCRCAKRCRQRWSTLKGQKP